MTFAHTIFSLPILLFVPSPLPPPPTPCPILQSYSPATFGNIASYIKRHSSHPAAQAIKRFIPHMASSLRLPCKREMSLSLCTWLSCLCLTQLPLLRACPFFYISTRPRRQTYHFPSRLPFSWNDKVIHPCPPFCCLQHSPSTHHPLLFSSKKYIHTRSSL